MLQAVASSVEEQKGDLAAMIAGLERVRVQVGAPQNADASTINHADGHRRILYSNHH